LCLLLLDTSLQAPAQGLQESFPTHMCPHVCAHQVGPQTSSAAGAEPTVKPVFGSRETNPLEPVTDMHLQAYGRCLDNSRCTLIGQCWKQSLPRRGALR
jgi:hypothetical protein